MHRNGSGQPSALTFLSSIVSIKQMLFSRSETIQSLSAVNSLALIAQKVFGIRSSEYRIPALPPITCSG